MRRSMNTLRVVAVCALILSGAAALALAGSENPSARVMSIVGSVEYRSSNGSAWIRLSKGQRLLSGGQIRTAARSQVDLLLLNRYRIEMDEKTTLTIPQDTLDGHLQSVYLVAGRLWARVVKYGSEEVRFEVETDAAVAGVRGTVFSVSYFDRAVVSVLEGHVEVFSPATDRRVMVSGGQQVNVERGSIPGTVTTMTHAEEKLWEKVGRWIVDKKGKKDSKTGGEDDDNSDGNGKGKGTERGSRHG